MRASPTAPRHDKHAQILQDPRLRGERLAGLPRFFTALRLGLGEDAAEGDGVFERSSESRLERGGIRTVHCTRILERCKVHQVGTLADRRAGEPVLDRFTAPHLARRRHRPAPCPPGVARRAPRSTYLLPARPAPAHRGTRACGSPTPPRPAPRIPAAQAGQGHRAVACHRAARRSAGPGLILVQISPDSNSDLGAGAVAVRYAQCGTLVIAQVREVKRAQERLRQFLPGCVGGNRCTVARLLGGIIWGGPRCRSSRERGHGHVIGLARRSLDIAILRCLEEKGPYGYAALSIDRSPDCACIGFAVALARAAPVIPQRKARFAQSRLDRHADPQPQLPVIGRDVAERGLDARALVELTERRRHRPNARPGCARRSSRSSGRFPLRASPRRAVRATPGRETPRS